MRWINYRHTNLERLDKSIKYICNPKSTSPEFCRYSNLREDKAASDFALIEKRWHADIHGRLYKHCVISFGVAELKPIDAFNVLDDIFSIYYGKYPYVFSVHTNIPHRIHGHCIMGMTHLLTGKRFSQSPKELRRFQKHYNEVMLRANLPLLKEEQKKPDEQVSAASPSEIIHEERPEDLWIPADGEYWADNEDDNWTDETSNLASYAKPIFMDVGVPLEIPLLSCEETIDICKTAIRRNIENAFNLALELEKGEHHE